MFKKILKIDKRLKYNFNMLLNKIFEKSKFNILQNKVNSYPTDFKIIG